MTCHVCNGDYFASWMQKLCNMITGSWVIHKHREPRNDAKVWTWLFSLPKTKAEDEAKKHILTKLWCTAAKPCPFLRDTYKLSIENHAGVGEFSWSTVITAAAWVAAVFHPRPKSSHKPCVKKKKKKKKKKERKKEDNAGQM